MADIFLSYAREDEPRARLLATALEAQGWSVWWDRRIPHGKDFNSYIQEQLDAARCIVVLWSKASVASQFVRDEASEGFDGRLVPALIEHVKQPLGFRQLHAADLTDWDGAQGHEEFERLVGSITALTPFSPAALPAPSSAGLRLERPARDLIFISYRREGTSAHVLALLAPMRQRFGAERLFKDSDNIHPGQDFVTAIRRTLESCAVMLVVIGKEWATIDVRTKRRRLDNPDDCVRVEVAAALANEQIVVMPVLIEGAEMPRKEDLPSDLQRLVSLYALHLSDARWQVGIDRLIRAIEKVIGDSPPPKQ
jgi:hypothetical protein